MRRSAVVKRLLVVGACLVAAPASADRTSAASLRTQGEQLAKDGQFAEAIEAFKAADAERPTTELACLIGLAYGRRNLYGQAELFFDLCHERAESGDPVPSWANKVEAQFRERLDGSKLARITIKVKQGRAPKVVVSAWAPDETFSPRAIHLPAGRHTITVTDAEGDTAERAIVVEGGEPQTVVIELGGEQGGEPEPERTGPSKLGRNLAFVGLGIAAVGVAVHATWYRSERDELQEASDTGDVFRYDAHVDDYTNARNVTVGLYGLGAVTAIVGLALHLRVSAQPTRGGAVVAVGWAL